MLRPDYPVRTERLLLRPLVAGDVAAVHAYQSRADVCRYIPYEPRTRETVAARVADPAFNRTAVEAGGDVLWLGIALADTDLVIGDVILAWVSAEHGTAEIGYVLHPDHQGRGYVTEVCRALLGLAFDGLGAHRVIGRVDARNGASARVLRRVGMRQEAYLVENEWFKGEWSDELDFAILADEWRAQQPG
ncbi:GNAT family N-acetyltransferase [uncultured Jatrophihabitans sp.]|uniref:GNAT family N-acetyltransferase n=1 Tax=uncultured Jatrophihabitans sp. TaxID=1610747 RepID=UPI0035CB4157